MRVLALASAAVLAAVLAVVLPGVLRDVPTVALPPPASLVGDVASDGTPVWIGHRGEDGTATAGDVWVVDATSPAGDRLTAWCPATGQLVDPVTGDRFDPRGRSIETSTPTGMTPLAHERDGDVLRLTERLPAFETLPFPPVDTADGRSCTGEGATDAPRPHPAAG